MQQNHRVFEGTGFKKEQVIMNSICITVISFIDVNRASKEVKLSSVMAASLDEK